VPPAGTYKQAPPPPPQPVNPYPIKDLKAQIVTHSGTAPDEDKELEAEMNWMMHSPLLLTFFDSEPDLLLALTQHAGRKTADDT
jgi:hypothetical protein